MDEIIEKALFLLFAGLFILASVKLSESNVRRRMMKQ